MKIIEQYKDMAGKHRVLVDIGTETIMLKFQTEPKTEQVQAEVHKILASRIKVPEVELAELNQKITALDEMKVQYVAQKVELTAKIELAVIKPIVEKVVLNV